MTRMSAEIGRVLGGRYRLVAPIGMGASAQVFLADDARLRRRVAVKMLHEALADDADFLRRFRAEARSAAALSHPHVMAVYDWGDDDTPFIVTEYLGGGSLRTLLDRGSLLTPGQALLVGVEAARALDYAHRRGFVHRDIKPANLLFGDEGRLRIADFGLARALAEAAWTEPQGAVLGTARYASPEQAKGETLTGKADVYSLALVLVEAVTGQVPFTADTTLGTLMARVDKPLPVPAELGPLRRVLERAGHPDAAQRIDARSLAAGLLAAAKRLPRPEPLPLAGALPVDGTVAVDDDPTLHAPGASAPVVAAPTAPSATDADGLTADDLDLAPPDWVNQAVVDLSRSDAPVLDLTDDGDATEAVDVAALFDADGEELPSEPEPDAALDPDGTAAVDVAALLAAEDDVEEEPVDADPADPDAAVVAVAPTAPEVDHEAEEDLDEVDPTVAVGGPVLFDREDHTGPLATAAPTAVAEAEPLLVPADGDTDEAPDAGRRHRRWPWVALVVLLIVGGGGTAGGLALADREPTVPAIRFPVPTLGRGDTASAMRVAQAFGWKVSVQHARKDGTKPGDLLSTTPAAGQPLERRGTLELVVSDGNTLATVPPDLVGQPLATVQATLLKLGLLSTVKERRYDEQAAKDSVLALADGTPSQLPKESTVGLVVSAGPKPRTIPSGLVGQSPATVKAQLETLGLTGRVLTDQEFSDTVPAGAVVRVDPASGTSVPRGSTVDIVVSKGPELVVVPDIRKSKSLEAAIAQLEASGLQAGDVTGRATGKPRATTPAAGTKVKKGSSVTIILR